ncbi:phage terminase, small subunit, P27 family (plasmid) [Planctopirus limnophila DSM 3776]|uniref:Phage terminase, small subunit, P27 family n=2 Tax=Planctopirus limnophila TaxID=120 RepID=D5SZD6_PLAL2|nr:phage terminase, small subunit, P27 family [Planctopirus limnophila DSM 3776]
MPKRGPKKKPAEAHLAAGTYREDRHATIKMPVDDFPEPPDWLGEHGLNEWRRLQPILSSRGLLTEVDWMAFSLLCQAWHDYIEATQKVAAEGIIAIGGGENGSEYQAPAVGVANKAWQRVIKGCQEFGCTPSARTGIVPKGGDGSEGEGSDQKARGVVGF